MNRTVGSVLTVIGVGFALYFAARGMWWTVEPRHPGMMIVALLLFLFVIMVATLWRPAGELKMPLSVAALVVATSVAIPLLSNLSLEPLERVEPFATWNIGAIGLASVVCIVRRRYLFGWASIAALTLVAAGCLGFGTALQFGLVGSIVWVVVAQLLVIFWDKAVRDAARHTGIQRAVSVWDATQEVRQAERRVRAQFALTVAGPTLTRTIDVGGRLTEDERLIARLAEGRLRDELRGAILLNDSVREAITQARRRGVLVTVFDEGGLDGIDEHRRMEIRDELATVLASAYAGRVIIRSAYDDTTAVTIVGTSHSASAGEDDSVDLWHEILRESD